MTLSSNLPLLSTISYTTSSDTVSGMVVISRLLGAVVGGVGTAPTSTSKGAVGPDVVSVSNASRVIRLVTSEVYGQASNSWSSDPWLFRASNAANVGNAQQAVLTTDLGTGESRLTLFLGNSSRSLLQFVWKPCSCTDSVSGVLAYRKLLRRRKPWAFRSQLAVCGLLRIHIPPWL